MYLDGRIMRGETVKMTFRLYLNPIPLFIMVMCVHNDFGLGTAE
jgi:hypothetical protein